MNRKVFLRINGQDIEVRCVTVTQNRSPFLAESVTTITINPLPGESLSVIQIPSSESFRIRPSDISEGWQDKALREGWHRLARETMAEQTCHCGQPATGQVRDLKEIAPVDGYFTCEFDGEARWVCKQHAGQVKCTHLDGTVTVAGGGR